MTEIKWTELPQTKQIGARRRNRIDRVADELKANPGRWALVAEDVYPSTRKPWQGRGLEVKGRRVAPGTIKENLYARYNPENAA